MNSALDAFVIRYGLDIDADPKTLRLEVIRDLVAGQAERGGHG